MYSYNVQVGSFEEAEKAVNVGVDAIIVQGLEAGGHVIGQVQVPLVVFFLEILVGCFLCSKLCCERVFVYCYRISGLLVV